MTRDTDGSGTMLTVLMTTRNGEGTLNEVLSAYERLEAPAGGWKLVVVDNASADATPRILARFAATLPMVTLLEPVPGQSRARNLGLPEVEGDIVVMTDDDAVPRSDWLLEWRRAADAQPAYAVFAGTVLPRWPFGPPRDLLAAVRPGPTWAVADRPCEGPVHPAEALGPNFALRASLLEDGLRFDTSLGPDGSGDYAMGSETEFLLRLAARGHRAWFAKGAEVEHIVRPHQIDPAWVLGRAVRHGRGCARVGLSRLSRDGQHGAAARLSFAADVLGRRLALVRARHSGDARAAMKARWKLCFLAGQAAEAHRMRRGDRGLGGLAPLFPSSVRALLAPAPASLPARTLDALPADPVRAGARP